MTLRLTRLFFIAPLHRPRDLASTLAAALVSSPDEDEPRRFFFAIGEEVYFFVPALEAKFFGFFFWLLKFWIDSIRLRG